MNSKRVASYWRPCLLAGVLLLTILLPSLAEAGPEASQHPPVQTAVTVISQNDKTRLAFELMTPAHEVDSAGRVTIAGLDTTIVETGAPELPYFSTYVAIPPGASYDFRVHAQDIHKSRQSLVRPVPQYLLQGEGDSGETLIALAPHSLSENMHYTADPVFYSDALYPFADYAIGEEILVGGVRLIKVDLFPLRYNAASNQMQQAAKMTMEVNFDGAEPQESPEAGASAVSAPFWRDRILNDPPPSWARKEQEQERAASLALPVGTNTYKLELNEDGLYEVSGGELAAAGMNIATVDPLSLQLMHRGQSVAYEFIDRDGELTFGPADSIRFFGWKFNGSRYEDMYVNNNVFWLWANGGGKRISSVENEAGKGYEQVTSFDETIAKWPHNVFFSAWRINWENSPNDATAWHWAYLRSLRGQIRDVELPIDLPSPVTESASMAQLTVEITTHQGALTTASKTYDASVRLNESAVTAATWENHTNLNIVSDVPITELRVPGDGAYPQNTITVELDNSTGTTLSRVYVTRATVEYLRRLEAVDDQLIFGHEDAGQHEMRVSGFSTGAGALVWDISDPYNPQSISILNQHILPEGTQFTYLIGRTHGEDARFIATTEDKVKSVMAISTYLPQDLTPPNKAGSWVAVAHQSLLPAADMLATFRTAQSGLSTWVVDVEEIVNQFGHGFNTPEAIRDYMRSALASWTEPPRYLMLFGDATLNPRQLECDAGDENICVGWDATKPTLVPTDLLFIDRFNGLVPVDYTFSLLEGGDLNPELSVARVPAETLAEARATVRKIRLYEQNLNEGEEWLDHIVFVADDPDSGGDFCTESRDTAATIPDSMSKTFLCLPAAGPDAPPIEESTADLINELSKQINDVGLSILNYRGHGSVTSWAVPSIMDTSDTDIWQNVGRPATILSADCLDGHFALASESEGLGETIIELDSDRGSAAHWSSSGFGFTFEHSVLHEAFYEAAFEHGITEIGDIVNYAKLVYLNDGYDSSEAFAFTLLGDPAMPVFTRQPSFLPVILGP